MQEHTLRGTGLLRAKGLGLIYRALDTIKLFPVRLSRLLSHFIPRSYKKWSIFSAIVWLIELFFYIIDLIGLADIYESLCDLVKFNTRPLTQVEKKIAKTYFGKNIPYWRVRIDEYSFFGPKFSHQAFVGFNTVNTWGPITPQLLLHELIHVWQYKKLGAVYIPRAIGAQFSDEGYDYGGIPNLILAIRSGKGLNYFNLEQQGDIVSDHYCLTNGLKARWTNASSNELWVFDHLLEDLKSEA